MSDRARILRIAITGWMVSLLSLFFVTILTAWNTITFENFGLVCFFVITALVVSLPGAVMIFAFCVLMAKFCIRFPALLSIFISMVAPIVIYLGHEIILFKFPINFRLESALTLIYGVYGPFTLIACGTFYYLIKRDFEEKSEAAND